MRNVLHSVELEDSQGNVFETFNNEEEYNYYMEDMAVDFNDMDSVPNLDFKTWYCIYMNNEIKSLTRDEYIKLGNKNKEL